MCGLYMYAGYIHDNTVINNMNSVEEIWNRKYVQSPVGERRIVLFVWLTD